jgi:hypothetical protein
MFQPNNQTLKEEHERRLGLVCTWVVQFPQEGKTERQLDAHIRRTFGVCRMTAHNYRRAARERLGAAAPDLAGLAHLLLEWGETAWDEVERAHVSLKERVKMRTAIIATLARLCPKHIISWQPPAEAPPFDIEEQRRFLGNGEDER